MDFADLFVTLKGGANAAGPYATLLDAQAAGAVTINYGMFVNNVISFVIVAFAVFMLVKSINKLKREEPPAPTPPPAEPPEDIKLLREIRDSLKK